MASSTWKENLKGFVRGNALKVAKETCKSSQVNGMSRALQPKLWQLLSWSSLEKLGISKVEQESSERPQDVNVYLFFPKERSRASLMPNIGLVTEVVHLGLPLRS